MSELITCTPRTLPPGDALNAARVAIGINPLNQPISEGAEVLVPDHAPSIEELAVATSKYWGAEGKRFTVGFLDSPSTELRTKLLSHLNAWNETANVEFVETDAADDAEVRINRERMAEKKWRGYWSFLGTDILIAQGPANQTMNLEGFTTSTRDSEFHRVVRHEAGHTLGFPHEHMRKELVERIDREKAIIYYHERTGWTREQIIRQVLTPLEEASIWGTPHADPNSIMAYQVPGSVTKDGEPIAGGTDIDESDYKFSALIYPKPKPESGHK